MATQPTPRNQESTAVHNGILEISMVNPATSGQHRRTVSIHA
ncbi:MAG TPA: hypothetical protein VNU46_08525 [Gemmatimonadaceae bacterium]|jgi:hypothetical protein|nr:hypothetical protein [Gemmatimonadaceae bacterium]